MKKNSYSFPYNPIKMSIFNINKHFWLFALILAGLLVSPFGYLQSAHAQGLSFPAEINKSFSPISIITGGVSRLSVTIFNPNIFQLTNAAWTDNLIGVQPGLSIASPVGLTNTCGGSVTAVSGSTTLSLSGGTVPAQSGTIPGSCTVSINVTSTTPGNLINTMPAGILTSSGGGTNITNTTPASATLNVTGPQPPTVAKNFNPREIWVGGISQLSISINNNDPSITLTQTSLTDTLPSNVFLANPVSPSLTGCGSSASLTAISGGTSVTLNNGTIAPNSTCTILVSVTSNVQGSYLNSIPANSIQTQQGITNAFGDSARLYVQAIGIEKNFSSTTVPPGGTTTLTITLYNPTGSSYTGVNVSDTLPGSVLTVVPGSAATTCGGTALTTLPRTVSLTGGTIPPGTSTTPGTCTLSVQVTAPAGAAPEGFTNIIPAGAITTNQGVTNLRPADDDIRISGTEVVGFKEFSPASIPPGGNSRLRIDIYAPSDTNLTNFSITDNLPAGVTVSNSTPPTLFGCGAAPPRVFTAPTGASSISLTNGFILAGRRCRINVYVTSSTPGVHTNTISPTNITNTENRVPAGDISASLAVDAAGNFSIDLVKGFNPLTVFGGSASTMSIQLINPSNISLTGIAFPDNMPTGMIVANPPNPNVGTCGGTIAATPGANTFSFSGGSLPPLSDCTLSLSVTMTVNGNLTNGIPANAVTTTEGVTNPEATEASLTNLPGASVSKFFSPNPITAGSSSTLTITIQNTGNIPLTGMGLIDTLPGTLPAGLVVANAPASVNTCGGTLTAVPGTQLIQLFNGSLGASSSCTIVVNVTGSVPRSYQNVIPAGALSSIEGATNSTPAVDTLVVEGGRGGGGNTPPSPTPDPSPAAGGFLIPVTGFAPGMVTDLSQEPQAAYSDTLVTLDIPSLSVNIPIVGVPKQDGTWNVAWLGNQAGWLEGSAFPSWNGNSVLTSHVYLPNGRPGPFAKLHELKTGDQIVVRAFGQKNVFVVLTNSIISPTDRSVMRHEERPWLTLVTCTDYDSETGTYKNRFIVRAVLVKASGDK